MGHSCTFNLWNKSFILLMIANFFYFGSFYLLIPTMPQYVASLGGDAGDIGVVMGSFTLAAVLVRPYCGRLSDDHGRKKLMLLGSGLFIFFPVMYGMIGTIAGLLTLRLVHGLAHASFMASSSAYLADWAPPDRRGEVFGMYGISNVLAMALFPAIGTTVTSGSGDFTKLFTLSALCAATGFISVTPLAEIGSYQNKSATPNLWEIGRRRSVLIPALTLFSAATSYGAVITFLPVFLPTRGDYNVGLFFTVYAVSTLVSRVVMGKVADRIERRKVITPVMILIAIASLMIASINSVGLLAIAAVLFGFGFGAFMPTLNALVVDRVAVRERGSALGFFTSFMDLGITAGSVIMGNVGAIWGYETMFYLCSFVVFAGLGLFAVGMKEKKQPLPQK